MRKKRTPEEWAAFKAEAEASIEHLRDVVARGRAELEARRREAERPRRSWRALFPRKAA